MFAIVLLHTDNAVAVAAPDPDDAGAAPDPDDAGAAPDTDDAGAAPDTDGAVVAADTDDAVAALDVQVAVMVAELESEWSLAIVEGADVAISEARGAQTDCEPLAGAGIRGVESCKDGVGPVALSCMAS